MGKNKPRINPPQKKKSKKIKDPPAADDVSIPQLDYPIFCLKHLHKDYNLDGCDKNHHSALVNQFYRLSQLTWNQINVAPRKGMGYEKIPVSSIKPALPTTLTEDVEYLLSFRYLGNNPFLGYRNFTICHVLFIDFDFTVYDHGS